MAQQTIDTTTLQPGGKVGEPIPVSFEKANANFSELYGSTINALGSASPPENPHAYMTWIDTSVSPAIRRIRNAANDDWVEIGVALQSDLDMPVSGPQAELLGSNYYGDIDPISISDITVGPGFVWAHETPGVRKIRNAANDAWITIGPIFTPFGTAAYRNAVGVGDLYSRGGILGAVSQSAGVPTGAIIQTGNSGTSKWTRFADGTQLIALGVDVAMSSWSVASGFFYTTLGNVGFPVAFSNTPFVTAISLDGNISARAAYLAYYNVSTTTLTGLYAASPSSVTPPGTTTNLQITAMGRWY